MNDILKTPCNDFACETCVTSKQTRKPHVSLNHGRGTQFDRGEKIHTDVCGPINIESPRGTIYFVIFKDDFSGFRKVYFLRFKSEALLKFKVFESFLYLHKPEIE